MLPTVSVLLNKVIPLELLGFWIFSVISILKKLENTLFQKLDQFLSSGEGGDIHSVDWRERGVSPPHLRLETNPVSETCIP
jgi:hypothetical protein